MEILIGYVIKLQFEMMDGSDGKEYLRKGGEGRSKRTSAYNGEGQIFATLAQMC